MIFDIVNIIIIIAQPPFEPIGEAEAIISIGVLFILYSFMLMSIILMDYSCRKVNNFPLSIITWAFSIDLAFGLIRSPDFPFIPNLQIFYITWQTIMLIFCSIRTSKILKERKRKKNDF